MGANAGKDLKRGVLAVMTSGTSEIKTGAGQYGDETVADSLFPKTVNDWALEDRQAGRNSTDAAAKAEVGKAAALAANAPDLTDALLKKSMKDSTNRLKSAQGRKSTFLTGAGGDISSPSKKSLLGSY